MEPADSWRSLADQVMRGAARRTAVSALVFAALFVLGGAALHRIWFAGGRAPGPLATLAAAALVPAALVLGILAGAGFAATSALRRALPVLERELHALLAPLAARLIERTPLGGASLRPESLRRLVDQELARIAPARRGFAPARVLANVVVRGALRLARAVLVRELLARLEREGASQVTAVAVERFVREKLVGLVVGRARTQVNAAHWTICAAAAALALGPVLYLLARG